MRLMRHDRRQPQVLERASPCSLHGGRLSCMPVLGPDYVLWVVPEALAARAGPRELARAVAEDLRLGGALAHRD
jgi:hypothetical protein